MRPEYIKHCPICGKEFLTTKKHQVFCSDACREAGAIERAAVAEGMGSHSAMLEGSGVCANKDCPFRSFNPRYDNHCRGWTDIRCCKFSIKEVKDAVSC